MWVTCALPSSHWNVDCNVNNYMALCVVIPEQEK